MTIAEKKIANRQISEKASQGPVQQRRVISDEPEVDIATVLANELLSSMRHYDEHTSDSPSNVLFDREFNGYRVILMRGSYALEPTTHLSLREQEIARMVAKGYHNKTIAAVLEISTWTVDTHLRRMYAKLGVNSRTAMVAQLTHTYDGK